MTEKMLGNGRKKRGIFCGATMIVALSLCCLVSSASAQPAHPPKDAALQVYFVDVEGGQATLFVTPKGQSLLIDTGWPDNQGRDADRIVAAAKLAGLTKIDFVLITHFHEDHVGGVPQLAAKIPIGEFIDHGENREFTDKPTVEVSNAYKAFLEKEHPKRMVAKPGDILPIEGLRAEVVSSDGNLIEKPLAGGGEENPACKISEKRPADTTENLRSLGTVLTFGKVRILDLGDLTWDKEMELMCPVNRLGKIEVLIVSHHGWFHSSSPALIYGIQPRLAIMDNGSDKGATPSTWDIIHKSKGLEGFWQLHYAIEGGETHNSPAPFLANLKGPDEGNYFKLTAWEDGSLAVYNSRTKETKKYPATATTAQAGSGTGSIRPKSNM